MQALVTGASGFIGPHLVKYLSEKGIRVRCLVRTTSDLSRLHPLSPEIVFGDVMQPDSLDVAVSGCDTVYHLAGLTKSVPARAMWKINEIGVENVARACAARKTKPRLVVLSSLAAAGPAPRDRPLTEADQPRPVSKYGTSKLKGEKRAFGFADSVAISIVRSPIVFGAGDLDGLALFKLISQTRLHFLPTLRNYRYSLIHAADLSHAMFLIAEKGDRIADPTDGKGIYFVAAEKNPTFAEYGHMIGDAMGVSRVFPVPSLSIATRTVGAFHEVIARLSGRAQIMNWDKTREALAGSWACSAERLNEELGFQAEMPIEHRLVDTVRWYVDHGHLPARVLPS